MSQPTQDFEWSARMCERIDAAQLKHGKPTFARKLDEIPDPPAIDNDFIETLFPIVAASLIADNVSGAEFFQHIKFMKLTVSQMERVGFSIDFEDADSFYFSRWVQDPDSTLGLQHIKITFA
jgi:hypothetical protein